MPELHLYTHFKTGIYLCLISLVACEPWNLAKKTEDIEAIQLSEANNRFCGGVEFNPSTSIFVEFAAYQPYRTLDGDIKFGVCVSEFNDLDSCYEMIQCNNVEISGDSVFCKNISLTGLNPLDVRYIKPFAQINDVFIFGKSKAFSTSTSNLNSNCYYCGLKIKNLALTNDTLNQYPNFNTDARVTFDVENNCMQDIALKELTWQLWLIQDGVTSGNGGASFGVDSLETGQSAYRSTWPLSISEVNGLQYHPGPAILEVEIYLSGNGMGVYEILRKQFPVILIF